MTEFAYGGGKDASKADPRKVETPKDISERIEREWNAKPFDRTTLQEVASVRDWADHKVEHIFSEYIKCFRLNATTSMSSWDIFENTVEPHIEIEYSVWRDGGYETSYYKIPIAEFFLPAEERNALWEKQYQDQVEAVRISKAAAKWQRRALKIANLKQQLKDLEG